MNCEQFEQWIDRYLDGELAGTFLAEFEAHVVECPQCGHLLAMMNMAGEVIASPADDEPVLGADFTKRVVGRITSVQIRRWSRVVRVSGAVAAAAVVLVVTSLLVSAGIGRGPVRPHAGDLASADELKSMMVVDGRRMSSDRAMAMVRSMAEARADSAEGVSVLREVLMKSLTVAQRAQLQAEVDFRDWFASTIDQAESVVGEIHELPGLAIDPFRGVMMDSLTEQRDAVPASEAGRLSVPKGQGPIKQVEFELI